MPDDPAQTLLIVAHADDEIIGAGNWMARRPEQERRRLTIAYVTDSAPRNPEFARAAGFETREEYAGARRREREAALEIAGILPIQCIDFGYTDQEACFHLVEITSRISELLQRLHPATVLTHSYEGGHPDHDAAAFAARAALNDLDPHRRPGLVEFASYHARGETLETMKFIPQDGCPETVDALTAAEQERKRAMFDCHRSQAHVLAAFDIDEERFRRAPQYDFSAAPHAGMLHYERLNWGISGEIWREQADQALELLRQRCDLWN